MRFVPCFLTAALVSGCTTPGAGGRSFSADMVTARITAQADGVVSDEELITIAERGMALLEPHLTRPALTRIEREDGHRVVYVSRDVDDMVAVTYAFAFGTRGELKYVRPLPSS